MLDAPGLGGFSGLLVHPLENPHLELSGKLLGRLNALVPASLQKNAQRDFSFLAQFFDTLRIEVRATIGTRPCSRPDRDMYRVQLRIYWIAHP